jgi:hypothetical protein
VRIVLIGDRDDAAIRAVVGGGEEENLGFRVPVGCRGSPAMRT